jgi:hypothetical protein
MLRGGAVRDVDDPARLVPELVHQVGMLSLRHPGDSRQVCDRPGQHLPPEPPLLHRAGVHVDQPGPLDRRHLLHLRPDFLESAHQRRVPGVGVRLCVAELLDARRHLEDPAYLAIHTSSRVCAR